MKQDHPSHWIADSIHLTVYFDFHLSWVAFQFYFVLKLPYAPKSKRGVWELSNLHLSLGARKAQNYSKENSLNFIDLFVAVDFD